MNAFKEYEILAGSSRAPFGGEPAGRPHVEQEIDITILIRRPKQLSPSALTFGRQFVTRRMLQFLYCADQPDLDLLVQFAVHYHLSVVELNKVKRLAVLRGTIEQVETAFRVQLTLKYKMGRVHRVRSGPVMIPKELSGIVVGVFGLDERPQARSHFRLSRSRIGLPIKPNAFDGNQLATIYDFPNNQGLGETIALIELGGGYREIDIQRFFTSLGLPCPTVIAVPVAGATNAPGIGGSDVEVALDIEVAGAVAPLSKIVAYFAPNTDQGFVQAILAAVHDTVNAPSVISISWGAAEIEWTPQTISAMNDAFQAAAAVGISVFCAAGDDGSNDNVSDGNCHVDFPASSPWVTGCGGTTLVVSDTSKAESAWNDGSGGGATGGGISDLFDRPSYQLAVQMPSNLGSSKAGRGVPDVAAVADPETGYAVLVDGLWQVVGGTSAVAPLFAGLTARINCALGRMVGLINSALYAAGPGGGFNDIVTGNNSADGIQGYSASPGWDAVTGWGSPGGNALLRFLSSSAR